MKVMKCGRCRKRCRDAENWNAVFNDGFITGYLCPGCQTSEERAEAVINEATIDYARGVVLPDGRVASPLKSFS